MTFCRAEKATSHLGNHFTPSQMEEAGGVSRFIPSYTYNYRLSRRVYWGCIAVTTRGGPLTVGI